MVTFSCFNCLSIHPPVYNLFGDAVSTTIWLLTSILISLQCSLSQRISHFISVGQHFSLLDGMKVTPPPW